ncbi:MULTISPECIES: N-acetylglucosamine-6-phosphate deacetylase [unclassified Agrococcus]|uniref:N-acetylglucosamine-6-phosphate deacetylase n=1 Tax=unclassified Agrococcus TaxID=2615065 RepID=UPI0036214332
MDARSEDPAGSTAEGSTLLRGRVVSDGMATDSAWVLVDAGRIVDVGVGAAPRADRTLEGAVVAPGFVDLHCHGGAGAAFDDGEAAIEHAMAFHRAHGTTRQLASLVTGSLDAMATRVADVATVAARDDRLLGVHLEGPCIAEARKGAHDATLLRAPDAASVDALVDAVGALPAMITLAPELGGGLDAVAALSARGWRVAVGHTDAEVEVGAAAFDAGATIVTHAFNGMRGLDHRAPGVLPAAFDDERVTIEVIADAVHVHPRMVRLLFDAAPGRVALITDAMAAAGQPDGDWMLGSLAVTVTDGVPRLREGGSIAGSTLTLDRAVRVAVGAGVPLETAIDAATRVPARALGVDDRFGSIAPGRVADLVVLDEHLEVSAVLSRGELVQP